MIQYNFHKDFSLTPPRNNLTIIQKLVGVYKLWHEFLNHFHKQSRYTLGEKIDNLFIEIIELVFTAIHLSKDQKFPYLQKASIKLDILKFFVQMTWEMGILDNKKYVLLSEDLEEIGKMLGGWLRQFIKNSPQKAR